MAKLLILLALVAIIAVTIEGKALKQGPYDLSYVFNGAFDPPGKREHNEEKQNLWDYFKRTPFRYFKRLDKNTFLVRRGENDYNSDLQDYYFKKSADNKQPSFDETFSP